MRKGIGVSPGVVVGVAPCQNRSSARSNRAASGPDRVPAEILRLTAVGNSAAELGFRPEVAQELDDSAADIFGDIAIVNDPLPPVQGPT
jgi:hypothetical protein